MVYIEQNATNVSLPKVNILPPSPQEMCNHKKEEKTLVCLATGFYPDHVSVTWQVNGKDRKDKVSTDPIAHQDNNTLLYHISSRIKVNGTDWENRKNLFTCIVRFYNGTQYLHFRHTISSPRVGVNQKIFGFGYILILAKSVLYALIVAGVVWKLKFLNEKKQLPED